MKKQNRFYQLMTICMTITMMGLCTLARAGEDDDAAEYDPMPSNMMKVSGAGMAGGSTVLGVGARVGQYFSHDFAKHFQRKGDIKWMQKMSRLELKAKGGVTPMKWTAALGGLMYLGGIAMEPAGDGSEDGPPVADQTEKPHRPVAAAAPAGPATAANGSQLK